MNELALFAGAGGGILGGKLLGWRTVCAVEIDPYCREVLAARQNEGALEPFPIWDDVCTFDGTPWRGRVDIVSGGFPCQDISAAGKRAGIGGERSGLWREMARIIGEVRPRYALVENSPMLTFRGLDRVLGDLATLGYDARWGVLGAIHAGAPHMRERIWIVAYDNSPWVWQQPIGECGHQTLADAARIQSGRQEQRPEWERAGPGGKSVTASDTDCGGCQAQGKLRPGEPDFGRGDKNLANASGARRKKWLSTSESIRKIKTARIDHQGHGCREKSWWQSEPNVGRVAHGVASRVDRLRGLGNGQVPAVVRLAWEILRPL